MVRETNEGLQELKYPGDQLNRVGDLRNNIPILYASHIKILGNLLRILPTNLLNYLARI